MYTFQQDFVITNLRDRDLLDNEVLRLGRNNHKFNVFTIQQSKLALLYHNAFIVPSGMLVQLAGMKRKQRGGRRKRNKDQIIATHLTF
jgi:hypothetical protein